MKPYSLILIGLVITTGFSAILYQHYANANATPQQQGITVGLDIKAYHDGQNTPYATRYLPNDLILDNFNNLLMAMFGQSTTSSECANIVGENGATGYIYGIWDNTVCTAFLLGMSTVCNTIPYCGGRIEIGTGSAIGSTDYKLVTQYGSDATVASSSCVAGSTDSVVVSGSIPITSTVTIQEAGLAIFPENAVAIEMLFFHDSFTGITTANGDTVTVQYTINLNNSGFNVNLCATLAGLFTGSITTINYPTYSGVSESLKNTAGGTNTFYVWCDNNGAYASLLATTSTCTNPESTNAAYIAIGTGSTAFTPTSVSLTGQIATATITSYNYISAYGEIYWGTSFNIGTTNTISEAGMFLILSGGNYMFAADTFTGQTETANQAWGITLQVLD